MTQTAGQSRLGWLTAGVVALLCILFATLAWTAVRGKSATVDEPAHEVVGWMILHRHDYRFSPDVPPLWEQYVALSLGSNAIHADWQGPAYRNIDTLYATRALIRRYMFQTPENNGFAIIAHGRVMCLALGVVLILVMARWVWEIAGPAASICMSTLLSLDPNFLAHAPLIKNDVATTLLYSSTAYALWRVGRRLTLLNVSAVALLTTATFMTKASGVLLGPVIALSLAARALDVQPWPVFQMRLTNRAPKLICAFLVGCFTLIILYAGTWASYGFRYDPQTPEFPFPDHYVTGGSVPDIPMDKQSTFAQLINWIDAKHLMPKPWIIGIQISPTTSSARGQAFVFGTSYTGGKWYYFPLAALCKTPLTTLSASALLLVFCWRGLSRLRRASQEIRWTVLSVAIPTAVYAIALLRLNLNIGIRHALPVYPLLYLAISWMAAYFWSLPWPPGLPWRRILTVVMGTTLAAESLFAYPNYISYFNVACGGPSQQLELLTDSNVDWGQDLPLLAQWEREHPGVPVHLITFSAVDPRYYGVETVPYGKASAGVLAIGQTRLRLLAASSPALSRWLLARTPLTVLGGSIYLYTVGNSFVLQAPARGH